MIKINIIWAISLYLFFTLSIVFIFWISYNINNSTHNTAQMIICSYCSFIFYSHNKKELPCCPRCKSYLDIETEKQKNNLS